MVRAICPRDESGAKLAIAYKLLNYAPDESTRRPAKQDEAHRRHLAQTLYAIERVVLTAESEAEAHMLFGFILQDYWGERARHPEWRGVATGHETECAGLFVTLLPWLREEHLLSISEGIRRGLNMIEEARGSRSFWRFRLRDFTNARTFISKLKEGSNPVSRYIRGNLKVATLELVKMYSGEGKPPSELLAALVKDLNAIMRGAPIYDSRRFEGIELSVATKEVLARKPLTPDRSLRLNRLLIEDAYLGEIKPRGRDRIFSDKELFEFWSPENIVEDITLAFANRADLIAEKVDAADSGENKIK